MERNAAIGQHFIVSGRLTEVVGVAQDGKYHDLQEPSQPVVYLALSQDEDETRFSWYGRCGPRPRSQLRSNPH